MCFRGTFPWIRKHEMEALFIVFSAAETVGVSFDRHIHGGRIIKTGGYVKTGAVPPYLTFIVGIFLGRLGSETVSE
jgi:hypothetical protein